jgi:hypothetical protein
VPFNNLVRQKPHKLCINVVLNILPQIAQQSRNERPVVRRRSRRHRNQQLDFVDFFFPSPFTLVMYSYRSFNAPPRFDRTSAHADCTSNARIYPFPLFVIPPYFPATRCRIVPDMSTLGTSPK